MNFSTTSSRPATRDAFVAVTALAVGSIAVLAAAWTERAEARERTTTTTSHHYSYGSTDARGGFSYALLQPGSNTTISSADQDDWKKFRRLMDTIDKETLWFSTGGDDYLVDDASAVAEAAEILGPMQALGERQGKLGAIQGELGAQQGRLGARQGALGARQGVLGMRLAEVVLARDADAERAKIEREMRDLERRQEDLSREQEPLARRQEELGRKQEALGRQQEEVGARALAALRELAEECMKNGKARKAEGNPTPRK